MKFNKKIEGELITLEMEGDLIGEDSGIDLIALVNDAIEIGVLYGIIDISKIRYINSAGIGVLITILTKLRNKGGEVYLLKPSESVQKLLIITKLNAIFTMVGTIEEAKQKIAE